MTPYVAETPFDTGNLGSSYFFGSDIYGCFHISDFLVGDAIIVNTKEGRVRALVTEVNQNALLIGYKTRTGIGEVNINQICFLSLWIT